MCGVQSGGGVSHCLADLHTDFFFGGSGNLCISEQGRIRTLLISYVLLLFSPHLFGQQMASGSTITGTVTDPSESVVVGAQVTLKSEATELARTQTDHVGLFRFPQVKTGLYTVVVEQTGFRVATLMVQVGIHPIAPLSIRLTLLTIETQIDVPADGPLESDPSLNQDAIRVSAQSLADLPILDEDYITTLSNLMDEGTFGTTGTPTISVDGVQVKEAVVSQSAVEEVRINQDPYSVEFWDPGQKRIEIITKSEGDKFHGAIGFIFRDAFFDARNPFASSRPQEQKRSYDIYLGGPIRRKKDAVFLSFTRNEDDRQAFVYADGPTGLIQQSVQNPTRWTKLVLRLTHEASNRHQVSFQYNLFGYLNDNYGVGGIVLVAAGANYSNRLNNFRFADQFTLSPAKLNQFQTRIEKYVKAIDSAGQAPKIIVEGAFTGGGAQTTQANTQYSIALNDIFSWTAGRHQIKVGVDLPSLSRNQIDDESDFGGTFYFSDIAAYLAQRPFLLTWQAGNPRVQFKYFELACFAQDQVKLTQRLSLTAGLRYDWQSYFPAIRDLGVRTSLIWTVSKKSTNILRAGAGIFYDRTGTLPIADLLRYNGERLRQYSLLNPSFSSTLPTTHEMPPANVVELAPNARIPTSLYYSGSFEHQLPRRTNIALTYRGSRGFHLFRSLDVNAPFPPNYLSRPNPQLGIVREIQSEARQDNDGIDLTFRGSITNYFTGQAQYSVGWTNNNSGGITYFPSNQYDSHGEWGRADSDRRHRLSLLQTIRAKNWLTVGIILSVVSGRPYTVLSGYDTYNDGMDNARPPGVPRNSLQGAKRVLLDLQASHDFLLNSKNKKGRALSVALEGFNLLNHVNYSTYVGVTSSPLFGKPDGTYPARRLQATVNFRF
jgi:hypothetical protein